MAKGEKLEATTGRSPWLVVIGIIFLLSVFSFFVLGFVALMVTNTESVASGNVAVIPIKGVIMIDQDDSLFATGVASSTSVVALIEEAEQDETIEAIVFDINSPGGSPVASAEIARAIKESSKPTVAVIREVGASGAYWAASAADHIIANEVSITGSIGVLASYLQYGDLLERYNVSYERFTAGKYKDMGTPYREMSGEEKTLYQSELDIMHEIFIAAVAENRGLAYDTVEPLATGQIYLGVQAVENGLVDQLGGKKEAYAYLTEQLGIEVIPMLYEDEKSFLELLALAMDSTAFNVGTGIGAVLVEQESQGIRL
jgi:protease-4